jgi:hypothetical protein
MEQQEHGRRLIRSSFNAEVTVLATALVAALSVRSAFTRHHRYGAERGLPLSSMLPEWGGVAVNLAFYVYLVWLCIAFFRRAQGKERVVVCGWLLLILLTPIQHFLSPTAADTVQYLKAGSLVVAFVWAVLLLIEVLGRDKALYDVNSS